MKILRNEWMVPSPTSNNKLMTINSSHYYILQANICSLFIILIQLSSVTKLEKDIICNASRLLIIQKR